MFGEQPESKGPTGCGDLCKAGSVLMTIENNKELEDFYRTCAVEWYPMDEHPVYQTAMENIEHTKADIIRKVFREPEPLLFPFCSEGEYVE